MSPDIAAAMTAYYRWWEECQGTWAEQPNESDAFIAGYKAGLAAAQPPPEAPAKPFNGTYPVARLGGTS